MKKVNFSESFKKFESQKLDKAHNLFGGGGKNDKDCEDPILMSASTTQGPNGSCTHYDWSDGVTYSVCST